MSVSVWFLSVCLPCRSFFLHLCLFYLPASLFVLPICLSVSSICLLHLCLFCLSVSLSVLSICLSDARGIGTNTTLAKSRRESPSQITRKEAQAIPAALRRNKADLFPYIPRISLSHYRIITLSNPLLDARTEGFHTTEVSWIRRDLRNYGGVCGAFRAECCRGINNRVLCSSFQTDVYEVDFQQNDWDLKGFLVSVLRLSRHEVDFR